MTRTRQTKGSTSSKSSAFARHGVPGGRIEEKPPERRAQARTRSRSSVFAPSTPKMQETRNKMPAASVCLLENLFLHREPKNLDEAIEMTSEWMEYYNRERPHSSLKNCSPLMYRENHATPLPANFWRDFSAPARLASLRSGRHAYASKSRQKWLDIRGYGMIYETHTPHAHKRGLKLAS